jgi:hypothetical protein
MHKSVRRTLVGQYTLHIIGPTLGSNSGHGFDVVTIFRSVMFDFKLAV